MLSTEFHHIIIYTFQVYTAVLIISKLNHVFVKVFMCILDVTSNLTRLEVGPKTFVKQDNEKVILGPEKMVVIPPRNYCVIENPVMKSSQDESVLFDDNGQAKLAFADLEIRFSGGEPFPLYPGEHLIQVKIDSINYFGWIMLRL